MADLAFADLLKLEKDAQRTSSQQAIHPTIPYQSLEEETLEEESLPGVRHNDSQQNMPQLSQPDSRLRDKHRAVTRSGSSIPVLEDDDHELLLPRNTEETWQGLVEHSDMLQDPLQAASYEPLQPHWPTASVLSSTSQPPVPLPEPPSDSLHQQQQEQQHMQHQLPHAPVAGLHTDDQGLEGHAQLPLQKTQRLTAMLPMSLHAALIRSAALGLDTASMQPAHQGFSKSPGQGIGRFRQQPQSSPGSASSSPAPDAKGQAATKADDESAAVISTQHGAAQMQHEQHKLAPLVATAQKGGQNVVAEELPGIRRRTSFKRPVKGGSSQYLMSGTHRSEWLEPEGSGDLSGVHDDRDSSVSSNGSSLLRRLKLRNMAPAGRVLPEEVPDMGFAKGQKQHTGPDAGIVSASDSRISISSLPQPGIHSNCIASHNRNARKGRKPSKVVTHDMLRQSITQVWECTLQLQEQLREQGSMRQVLQVMNAQTVHVLDSIIFAAEKQQSS